MKPGNLFEGISFQMWCQFLQRVSLGDESLRVYDANLSSDQR
jgi:hypothetical protein